MGTRSRIGMVQEDGTVKSVYCQWDGSPKHNGIILKECFTDVNRVKELIALGDLYNLRPNLYPDPIGGYTKTLSLTKGWDIVPAYGEHTHIKPQVGVIVAYHRDCGELMRFRCDNSVDDYIKSDLEEYGYLFKDGRWYLVDNGELKALDEMEELKDANLIAKG